MISMETSSILEINLISAQGLKPPSNTLRRMQTYAVASVDSSFKLRTRLDRVGGENPTWNDKFIFRVTDDFLSKETSAVTVEIYSVGYLKDTLVGTVRFLIRNCLSGECSNVGFAAIQIRRPSGRFQGILNIGASVINSSDISVLGNGVSAMGYQDLMGERDSNRKRLRSSRRRAIKKAESIDENYCENSSCADTEEFSDSNSSCSSTTTTTSSSTVLSDWNGRRERAGNKDRLNGSGLLCGLGFQRKNSSDSVRSEIAD